MDIKQLAFIAFHIALILLCYWVSRFSMLSSNKPYIKWHQKLMPYLRCVVGAFWVAVIFSGGNTDYFYTRFVECLIPAFVGIYSAKGKEGTKYKKYMDSFGNMH